MQMGSQLPIQITSWLVMSISNKVILARGRRRKYPDKKKVLDGAGNRYFAKSASFRVPTHPHPVAGVPDEVPHEDHCCQSRTNKPSSLIILLALTISTI